MASALALALSTSAAMATSHPCNIDDHPDQATADADGCIGSPEYTQALRDAGQDGDIATNKTDITTNSGAISTNSGAISTNAGG